MDGHWGLYPGEYYANVAPDELAVALKDAGFVDVDAAQVGLDTQATAIREARCG